MHPATFPCARIMCNLAEQLCATIHKLGAKVFLFIVHVLSQHINKTADRKAKCKLVPRNVITALCTVTIMYNVVAKAEHNQNMTVIFPFVVIIMPFYHDTVSPLCVTTTSSSCSTFIDNQESYKHISCI